MGEITLHVVTILNYHTLTSVAVSTHHILHTALQIESTSGDVGIGTENYPDLDKADTRGPSVNTSDYCVTECVKH